ncbi:MAG: hypothetical protein HY814_02495 [Candidatus Riflebacteria bacterium]|nr:hypothetical protein [Candidatus Riflebacteria bacterium]
MYFIRPVPELLKRLVLADRVALSAKTRLLIRTSSLRVEDVLHAILEGRLVKRERDELSKIRWKYTVIGPALGGRAVYCCGKVLEDEDGKMYFIITAHWAKSP